MALRRPETLTTAVASYIKDAIVGGDFAPGARLPEVALATDLNTSRGTVREALRTLAVGGLIDIIPRRGVFVSQLSVRATWEISSLRALLEPYAARLALEANGSDPAMLADVKAAFDELRIAVTSADPVAVADADVAFHRSVFQRCGHEMLLSELDTLQVLSRRIVLTNQLSSADAPTLIAQHEPIAAAVELRDPALLEASVRTHVIEAGELLMTRMAALEPNRARRADRDTFALGRWPTGAKPHPRRTGPVAGNALPSPKEERE
ncbi:MAG TPA: GntR family transcriptional regulator [Patescibacteria group bacterium]|nr:GntR family transcriptional regulator [Patescibacteria group bacterium]